MLDTQKKHFNFLNKLQKLEKAGKIKFWNVIIPNADNTAYVKGRLCVIRKTEEAIKLCHKKLKRKASKNGNELNPRLLFREQ